MLEDYKSALRAGQRAYRARIARGQSPYLAVLDDVLKGVDIVAQEPLGLVEIPSDSLVGTKTSGRHTAFSYDFMPLLEPDTEFAAKWSNLCDAHLEEGIHTPIIAFEYMNRFYVQEGNKRVSVLKYYGAVKIPGTVTRLIPARTEDLENKIYYEFLDFYKLSKVNYVHFSKLGGYSKLQTLVCKASGEAWSEDDRLNFAAFYTMFHQQFEALGGRSLGLTTGDALLVYLSVYRYSDTYDATPAQVRQNLEKLWNEVKVLTEPHGVELSLEPPKSPAEPLLSKLNIFSPSKQPSELRVVFLHEYNAKISAWVRAHDEGRDALAKVFPDKVYISCYEDVNCYLPGECEPGGGRGADIGGGSPQQCGRGVRHQRADVQRLPEGGGAAPQDPHPELLAERAAPAGAHLLPPHLRGDLSAGDAGRYHDQDRAHRLCGGKPRVRRARCDQRLCAGAEERAPGRPYLAALGLPARCRPSAGFC